MSNRLEAILKYKMTQLEGLAYKVALLWEDAMRKERPTEEYVKLRTKGDPRKSVLFKYCYKLVRETQGTLKPNEYRFYVLAQIQIMGKMGSGGIHALIEPGILVGPKAWVRWRWWKEKYDRNMRILTTGSEKVLPQIENIEKELISTKKFVGECTKEQVKEWITSKKLQSWLVRGKISAYFIILHPFVAECVDRPLNEVFEADFGVYQVSDEIRELFRIIFFDVDRDLRNQASSAKV